MPVSYLEAIAGGVRQEVIAAFVLKIDTHLRDMRWVIDCRCGPKDDSYWTVTHDVELTPAEKDVLVKLYAAGWGAVKVTNSSDTGERAGCCGITLYQHRPGWKVDR